MIFCMDNCMFYKKSRMRSSRLFWMQL